MGNAIAMTDSSKETDLQNIPEGNGRNFLGVDVPEEILQQIFMFVSPKDLLRSVSLVCKHWNDVVQQHYLWWRKLDHEHLRISQETREKLIQHENEKFSLRILKAICTRHLLVNENLIKNPYAIHGKRHWKCNPNNMVTVEGPIGSDPIPEEVGTPAQTCFATSYVSSTRGQTVSLARYGFDREVLEFLRPKICVSEWVSARWDCRSMTELQVHLKSEGGVLQTMESVRWSSDDEGIEHRKWYKMEMEVVDYPGGVCEVVFVSKGRDLQYWAGFYGAKTTASTLKLVV